MEDYSFDCDELFGKKKYVGLRDYHLRSALTTYSLRSSTVTERHKNLKSEVFTLEENYNTTSRDPNMILGRILNRSPLVSSFGADLYHAGYSLSIEGRMYDSLPTPFYDHAASLLMNGNLQTKYFMTSLFLQRAVIVSNSLNAKKNLPSNITITHTDQLLGFVTSHLESLKITLKVGSECFGVLLEDGLMSIHDLDHLKNWSDKCTERFNLELACIFGHHLNPIIYPPISMLYSFFSVWDWRLEKFGNRIYKTIKVFEALVIGLLLNKNPNNCILLEHDFLKSTIGDFARENQADNPELCDALADMYEFLLPIVQPQYLSQFYGLYRIWGHPIVSPRSGIEKVMLLGTKRKNISKILPVMIRRVFMCKYSCWFKSTKGSYPIIDSNVEDIEGNHVRELLKMNGSVDELKSYIVSPLWDHIRFCHNIEMPVTFNLSEMVADKAVSPDRSALIMLAKRPGGNMYDATYRRGVLQWLLRPAKSCKQLLEDVNNQGLPDEDCVIGLYQKERELNEKPRMFALMPHNVRNYVVTTESMLSEDILPAFSGITMTNSLLALQKKIYSVSYQQAKNESGTGFNTFRDVTIIMNVDFEKWNLNFRKETTEPMFTALGDLYGLENLYNRTYDIFEKSYVYLADGSYRPKISPDGTELIAEHPFSYYGHLGGFEGLRQKGWTLFTDCGLELICNRHKCSYQIMGQGDNQVLILTWRTYLLDGDRNITPEGKRRLSEQYNKLMIDLVQTFGELGLPVKALETWSSEHLFLYGKFPTLRGVPLAMSLKKICRAYYLANEEIMTLDCSLATIQSNAMAACMSDVTSHVPYVVYKIQVMMALNAYSEYHVLLGDGAFVSCSDDKWRFTTSSGMKSEYKIGRGLSKWKALVVLSWFPKILGGLSIATWFDFLMRGFPDKVSQAFTWIKMLMKVVDDPGISHALETIYQTHINPEKNFVLLIEDPCALNLVVPVDARAAMKQAVQDLFEGLDDVKNLEFATLFRFNKEWEKEELCKRLCKGEVLHPRFLHDLVAATPGGYIDSIVSKVSKASTINKTALRSSSRNPGDKIQRHEKNMMRYLLWKVGPHNTFRSHISHLCPTEQARDIRARSWGKRLETVTVPFPLAFLGFRHCSQTREIANGCDLNYISVSLPEIFSAGDLSSIHSLGSSPPYLGSETKEKISGDPNRSVFGREPLIMRPLRLLRTINWFVPQESHAADMIKHLLRAVSNLDPDEYVSKEMGITGSEAHRYRDQALKHGVMTANMYTLGSHMHISTDPWKKYTRGADNYTINYQAILCALQSLIGEYIFWCCSKSIIPAREYHFHETCESCIEKLTETFHDLCDNSAMELIPSGEGNPYLWVDNVTLVLKYKHDPILCMNLPEMTYNEYLLYPQKRRILTEWISSDICDDLLSESSASSLRMLNSRDYPRVLYKKLSVKELWEQLAIDLISRAGVKYSSTPGDRLAYLSTARELAADDMMKSSVRSILGASMFYTWEDKFGEIASYDDTSVYPDTNPPTLESACTATRINLREIIRRVDIVAPPVLVIPRTCRNPDILMKAYWYKILLTEGIGCPQCIRDMCCSIISGTSINKSLKCELGHTIITSRMMRIVALAASEDKLLKDSVSFNSTSSFNKGSVISTILTPGVSIVFDSHDYYVAGESVPSCEALRIKNETWTTAMTLPTSSKVRVHEMHSVLKSVIGELSLSEGAIFGDGLGTSSQLLSEWFPEVNWVVSSLYDSECAIPQSYPHVLVPMNPSPPENVNYRTGKRLYNDILSSCFHEEWSPWINGGICWYEAEPPEDKLLAMEKVLELCKWDVFIGRSELSAVEIKYLIDKYVSTSAKLLIVVCGSLNINSNEVIVIRIPGESPQSMPVDGEWLRLRIERACDDLYALAGRMCYAEYLVGLESVEDITKMIRRCDYWMASVGLTHYIHCKKLFTPIWWDIQTGKIPQNVKDLGANKTYFMYVSDLVALQSRLIAISLSLLSRSDDLVEEISKMNYWKLCMRSSQRHVTIYLERGPYVSYGPDQVKIKQFIPIMRKLNQHNRRWWKKMPERIVFSSSLDNDVLWISRMSLLLPNYLPEIE